MYSFASITTHHERLYSLSISYFQLCCISNCLNLLKVVLKLELLSYYDNTAVVVVVVVVVADVFVDLLDFDLCNFYSE